MRFNELLPVVSEVLLISDDGNDSPVKLKV